MVELTGEIADGSLGTSFVPEGADAYFAHLDAGLTAAGRTRADLDVCQGAAGVDTVRLYPAGQTLDEQVATLGRAIGLVREVSAADFPSDPAPVRSGLPVGTPSAESSERPTR